MMRLVLALLDSASDFTRRTTGARESSVPALAQALVQARDLARLL